MIGGDTKKRPHTRRDEWSLPPQPERAASRRRRGDENLRYALKLLGIIEKA
jgi:hypothetical protein